MRNRTYDPALGQFLSRDPLETATGDAYNYANNNPIDLTDPTGQAPGISISISISITSVPQPRPQYNAPMSCDRDYGLCEAMATAPPGANVRCSARFGCTYFLSGQERPCPAYDCGYRSGGAATPSPHSSGGQSGLCSAARFLGYGDIVRGARAANNGDLYGALENFTGVAAVDLSGRLAGEIAVEAGEGALGTGARWFSRVMVPVGVVATVIDPLAC